MRLLRALASTKLTLVGMLLLAIGAMLSYGQRLDVSAWVLVVPMALMALNLLAAILTNRRINRQPGLLIFHLGLLAIVLLAALGRLTHLNAQLEILEGETFAPRTEQEARARLQAVNAGPWHPWHLLASDVRLTQGAYQVKYESELRRGATYSRLMAADGGGRLTETVVGDDNPLIIKGYRFYTSFNKGFSVVITWIPDGGQPVTGSVNMPSYPLFDYKQKNEWTPFGMQTPLKLWLTMTTAKDERKPWVLERGTSQGVLAVTAGEQRVELREGESARLEGGTLRYDRLAMWMGYTIFFDPTLIWLFWAAVGAVLGMGWHLWRKVTVALDAEGEPDQSTPRPKDGGGTEEVAK